MLKEDLTPENIFQIVDLSLREGKINLHPAIRPETPRSLNPDAFELPFKEIIFLVKEEINGRLTNNLPHLDQSLKNLTLLLEEKGIDLTNPQSVTGLSEEVRVKLREEIERRMREHWLRHLTSSRSRKG